MRRLGGGGGVPFLRDELLLVLIAAILDGMKVGVCVRECECESGAETKEAVELVVPVRRGSGGGLSSSSS